MPQARHLLDASLARLQVNIASNVEQYSRDEPWLPAYFGSEAWHHQAKVNLPNSFELQMPTGTSVADSCDLENTRILYKALKSLTPTQASDERLWAYLSHVTFWKYMRLRWPIEKQESSESKENYVCTRYLFMKGNRSRALVSNGIARLWWYGYTTYDEHRDDPFELTTVLLKKLDVTNQLLERNFSRNRALTKTVLTGLSDRDFFAEFTNTRIPARELLKHIQFVGGVSIIDSMPSEEFLALVKAKIDELASPA